jgi:hypothetical protein
MVTMFTVQATEFTQLRACEVTLLVPFKQESSNGQPAFEYLKLSTLA